MPLSELAKGLVDEWDQMIDVNLRGTLIGIDAALPTMRKQHSSHIINVTSLSLIELGPRLMFMQLLSLVSERLVKHCVKKKPWPNPMSVSQ
jgi:hypothetical protein